MRRIFLFALMALLIWGTGCEEVAKKLYGTISGTVRDDGSYISGALVLLLEYGDTATAGMSLSNGSATNSSGRYTIVDVEIGEYFVCAIDDNNGNLIYDPGVDAIGYYGTVDTLLGISIPAMLKVEEEGQDIDNVNIDEMYILPVFRKAFFDTPSWK